MLLYMFWHWPRPEAPVAEYEADEADFQRAVQDARPQGLLASAFVRSSGSPWANEGRAAYEDLWLLTGSVALDVLNEAAVQGARKASHDRLAAAMLAGAGGLYSLALGAVRGAPVGPAAWFRKPQGVPFDAFYAAVKPAAEGPGASLWRRQMVLGPAPEFVAYGFDPSASLPDLDLVRVTRETLWSSLPPAGRP
jgi:hypothetical protein